MGEVIVVTSGKGGVGKTTTTANVGTGLAKLDKKVVLIDTDIGLRNLDVVMGLENRIVYNLVDVVEGNCRAKQAMIKDKRYPNLYLLPSAQTRDKNSVTALLANIYYKSLVPGLLIHWLNNFVNFVLISGSITAGGSPSLFVDTSSTTGFKNMLACIIVYIPLYLYFAYQIYKKKKMA